MAKTTFERYLEKKKREEEQKKLTVSESSRAPLPSVSEVKLSAKEDKLRIPETMRSGADTLPAVRENTGTMERYSSRASAKSAVQRLKEWHDNNSTYIADYQTRMSGLTGSHRDGYVSDASNWLSSVASRKNSFDTEAESIKGLLERSRSELGDDWVDAAIVSLDMAGKTQSDVLSDAENYSKYWSQWDNEDSYNEWAAAMKDREEKLNYDLDAALAEIGALERAVERLPLYQRHTSAAYAALNEKTAYYNQAKELQRYESLMAEAVNSPTFKSYSELGKSDPKNVNSTAGTSTSKYSGRNAGIADFAANEDWFAHLTEEEKEVYNYHVFADAKNGTNNAEEFLKLVEPGAQSRLYAGAYDRFDDSALGAIFYNASMNVVSAFTGIEALFSEDGSARHSAIQGSIAESLKNEKLKDIDLKYYNFADKEWENADILGDSLGQWAAQGAGTIANMVPSILTTYIVGEYAGPEVGRIAGAGMLGLSAAGSAKQQMLDLGYGKSQANAYGALVGASETLLEYAFGGISKLGGKVWDWLSDTNVAKTVLSKVDNVLMKIGVNADSAVLSVLTKTATGMGEEALEEGLQTILEPWFESAVTGADYDAPDFEEVLYSSLLGALTAVGLEGAGSVANAASTVNAGKNIQKSEGGVQKLVETGKTYSADSVAYKLANKIEAMQSEKKSVGAHTIGKLFIEEGATLSEQNRADIIRGLEALHVDSKSAKSLANTFAGYLDGSITLTDAEGRILEQAAPLSRVLREKIIGENTTAYQRTKGYTDLGRLADGGALLNEDNVKKQSSESAQEAQTKLLNNNAPYADPEEAPLGQMMKNVTSGIDADMKLSEKERSFKLQREAKNTQARSVTERILGGERKFVSSRDGAVTLKENGQKVKVAEVASTDGGLKLRLTSGKVVDASEISFSNEKEALVYEYVANMGTDKVTAWSLIKQYDPRSSQSAEEYVLGATELFEQGKLGIKDSKSLVFGNSLTVPQRQKAYNLGVIKAKYETQTAQAKVNAAKTSKKIGKGEVIYDASVDRAELTEAQAEQTKVVESMASVLGMKVHFFASNSVTSSDGRRTRTFKLSERESTSANGWYDPSTGEIWIDVNAGVNGEGLILNTASHELTHFIKDWSPAKYKVFADFLMESYGEKGVSVESLIEKQIEKAKKNDRSISREEAFDEVVADSCESFLQDSNAAVKIASLEAKDKTLAQKIRTFIGQLLAKVRKLLSGTSPDSAEGKLVREMSNSLEKLHELWTDALADAGKSFRAAGTEINDRAEKSTSKLSDRFDNSFLESAYNDYDKPISADDIIVLRSIGRKSINEFTSEEIEKAQKWAYKFYNEMGVKSPFFRAWFGDWRAYDENRTSVSSIQFLNIAERKDADGIIQGGLKSKTLYRGNVKNSDTEFEINIGAQVYNDTLTYANRDYSRKNNLEHYAARISILKSIKDIVESAILLDTSVINDKNNPNRTFMHYFYNMCEINGTNYLVKLGVDEINSDNGAIRRAYNVNNIKISPIAVSQVYKPAGTIGDNGDKISTISIAQLFEFVNTYDDNFEPKPVSREVLNADGTPKIVYHGTDGDFTSFNYGEIGNATGVGILGDGFYFTDKKTLAKNYGKNVMPCYLKMSNPFIASASDVYKLYSDKLSVQGYDGVILKAPKGNVYMVFDNTQIKSATDNIGTFDGENADIRYSDRDPDAVSNREVLANALKGAAKTEGERKWLEEYQRQIGAMDKENDKLDMLRAERAKLRKESESRNRARIEDLSRMITKSEEKINRYDRQLLEIEAGKPLRELLSREKKAAADKIRAHREQKLAEQRAEFREQKHRASERHDKTTMRKKIRDKVDALNKLLLNPTKEKHIPMNLQKPVAEILKIVNMDTVGAEKRIAKLEKKLELAKTQTEVLEITRKINYVKNQGESIKERLQILKAEYDAIAGSDDPVIAAGHHPEVSERIGYVTELIGDTALKDMDLEQLDYLYETFTVIETVIRKANKGFKLAKGQTISDYSSRVMTEIRKVGGSDHMSNKLLDSISQYRWNNLKPVYAFERIGSDTFRELFENVRAGEDTWATDVSEAREFFLEQSEKYHYFDWDMEKTYAFEGKFGKKFELALPQMMSLYAYSKRKQADLHLEEGGFVFEDAVTVKKKKFGIPVEYTVKKSNPFSLSREQLALIVATLTEEQRSFVDDMQNYLSSEMGAKGNEVSREMYGIDLFKETDYFPLKSSNYYLNYNPEKDAQARVKNYGMAKETIKNANNPIILSGFMDVWSKHIDEMSMYHAFVLPMEDFSKVFNFNTPTVSDSGNKESVQQYLADAYGDEAIQYIKNLLTDLNGGARSDPTLGLVNKLVGKFKKAKVFLSASVVVQQPSAIGRAFALINPKYFTPNLQQKHSDAWRELKKYAPVAIIKEMGYFDTSVGKSTVDYITGREYHGIWEKAKGIATDKNYRDEAMGKLPALADELTWNQIWQACKNEIADTTDLKRGSEEFLTAAGKRFTEVVTKTQVYDSMLSRSAWMRSNDGLSKMITSFLAEPTTTANMMGNAILQAKRGDSKVLPATLGAVAASVVMNSVLVSLVYASRDDDEDEAWTEKYVDSLITELLEGINPATYLPIIKDVWSLAQGYDVERSDMSLISDLFDAFKGMFSESKSLAEKIEELSTTIADLCGLPLNNVLKDVKAAFNFGKALFDDIDPTAMGMKYAAEGAVLDSVPFLDTFIESTSKNDKLYDAVVSGDAEEIARAEGRYKTDAAVSAALKSALRENDSRVKKAAQALRTGNVRSFRDILKQIEAEGNFDSEMIEAAIRAEASAFSSKIKAAAEAKRDGEDDEYIKIVKELRESYRGILSQDDIVAAVNAYTFEVEAEDELPMADSIYKSSDINTALDNGDTELALEIIEELVAIKADYNYAKAQKEAEEDGKRLNEKKARTQAESSARSSVRSSMTSYWKKRYLKAYADKDRAEMEHIRKLLHSIGVYGKLSELDDVLKDWRG